MDRSLIAITCCNIHKEKEFIKKQKSHENICKACPQYVIMYLCYEVLKLIIINFLCICEKNNLREISCEKLVFKEKGFNV